MVNQEYNSRVRQTRGKIRYVYLNSLKGEGKVLETCLSVQPGDQALQAGSFFSPWRHPQNLSPR